jgi:hypothetical protein
MTVVAKTRQFQSCENLTKEIVANSKVVQSGHGEVYV